MSIPIQRENIMPKHSLLAGALLCLWAGASQADASLDALRAEIRQMRESYETRLAELENRLRLAETRAASFATTPAPTPAPTATGAPDPTPAPLPAPATAANSLNPEVSLVLQGSYAERKSGERHITGFLTGGHDHGGERGFKADHTELTLAANIDPNLRGYANIAFADDEVEVEEAWFQTLGLGNGFTVKGGRFLSGIGYANEQHPHVWDFADNSLMYSVLFGEHFGQDGLQFKWLAPTDRFLELGVELGRGGNFPGSEDGGNKNGAGAWAAFAHVGDDVGASASWRAGLSYIEAKPRDRESHVEDLNDVEAETLFSGKSKTWVADLVWKWAPDGNPKARNFKFQAEYFHREEDGDLTCVDNGPAGLCNGTTDAYDSRQSGWYAQAVYQFMPRWRAGIRYDRLDSGDVDMGLNGAFLPVADYRPDKWSLMADYSPSEYSRFRLQLARDHSMDGSPDNHQLTLQYIHNLGPHGAHRF
jgi:hypothetical protein